MNGSPLTATVRVVQVLEALGVPYVLVGSVASSLLGIPRATADADMVADLPTAAVPLLVEALHEEFYIDAAAVYEAVRNAGCFNVVHFASGYKVDVYLPGDEPFEHTRLARRLPAQTGVEPGEVLYVATPEDLILSKLAWYRLGRHLSQRQWTDVLGLLQVHRGHLDLAYLHRWAEVLEILDLLQKALDLSGRLET